MILFDIVEPIFVVLVFGFLFSQCLVPEILDRPWFPLVRRVWRVPAKISETKELIAEKKLDSQLSKLQKEARCPIHQ